MRFLIYLLRLCVALPMVIAACWIDDVADALHRMADKLARLSYRVEGDDPRVPVDNA